MTTKGTLLANMTRILQSWNRGPLVLGLLPGNLVRVLGERCTVLPAYLGRRNEGDEGEKEC